MSTNRRATRALPGTVDAHLLVVGAGISGLRTVEAARLSGWRGPVTIVGAHPGLPHDLPPLSKQILSGEWPAERAILISAREIDDLGVTYVENDPAVGLDRQAQRVELRSGASLGYDALVIATGASARQWDRELGDGVHTIRTLADAERLRDQLSSRACTVAVVGSGFVAAEVAASIAASRTQSHSHAVHLVCRGEGPCEPGLGAPIARWLRTVHERHGVIIHAGDTAERIEHHDGGNYQVHFGGDTSSFSADTVVLGIGSTPNIDWLAGSGLSLSDGVETDSSGRVLGATPGELIYALGDCARWTSPSESGERGQHWTRAVEQARTVGSMLGSGEGPISPPSDNRPVPYVWSDQFEAKLQVLGRVSPDDDALFLDTQDATAIAVYGRGRHVTAVVAAGLPREVIRMRRVLQSTTDTESVLAEMATRPLGV